MELRSKRRKLSTSSTQPEPRLPPEVWETIFDNLFVYQLLRVRRTCRHWKQIVDGSPVLRDKIAIRFHRLHDIDEGYTPEPIYPAPYASFFEVDIVAQPKQWWPSFGASLLSLKLERVTVPLGTLLWMLRHTSNLSRLVLECAVSLDSEAEVDAKDLQLEKLECLELRGMDERMMCGMLAIFREACPRLKHVDLGDYWNSEPVTRSVNIFLRAVQHSLRGIVLDLAIDEKLGSIGELDELRLKRFSFEGHPAERPNVISILRKQTTLEDVTMTRVGFSVEILCDIGRSLPHLRRLAVGITEDHPKDQLIVPSFLATMAGLREFSCKPELSYSRSEEAFTIDFRGVGSPSLKQLKLCEFRILPNSFCQYLKKSPNIHTLWLSDCKCSSWPELFSSIAQLKHLRRLRLQHMYDMYSEDNYFSSCLHSLQTLTIISCKLSKNCLMGLLRQCPNLVELQLRFVYDIDDEVFLAMCQQLKRIRKLMLFCFDISDLTARYIIDNCSSLELLVIEKYRNFSENSIRQIQTELGIGITVICYGSAAIRYW